MIRQNVIRSVLIAVLAGSVLAPPQAAFAQQTTAAPAPPAAVAPPSAEAAAAWGIAGSDLTPDPAIRYGVLPNGMKYAIRRNTTPVGTVALRLRFDIGSVAEADDERGLAHFLEHMAFNGSTNVPEGQLVPLLERNGLAFGPDTNASTGFDQTIYQLDLPNASGDLVDLGLKLMRETASELTIAPGAVDRERGVIQSERRARDSFALRNLVDSLAFTLPDTPLPNRLPIGTDDVILNAPASRLQAFYNRYYRPERATLVVVGDIDVAEMEARIRARFADWQGRGPAGADPDFGRIDTARVSAADNFVHPEIPEIVNISLVKPAPDRPDTQAVRAQRLAEALAGAIINRRLATLATSDNAPFSQAQFSVQNAFERFQEAGVQAVAPDGQWQRALTAAENELRRVFLHGFTAAELDEQRANFRSALANAADGANTRQSAALAGQIISALGSKRVVTTPADQLAAFDAVAPALTPQSVQHALVQQVAGSAQPLVRVASKTAIDGGDAAILAAFRQAATIAVAPPGARAAQTFAYMDFGTPGRVVADDRIDDLGVRRVRFANNVMLNIKRTDFEAGRVRMQLRVDGGNLLNTRDDPTRVALAGALFLGGLEAHSVDELRSLLAGRTVSASFTSATDSFGASVATTPADLTLQAQVLAAFLVHPGYRSDGLALLRRVLPQQYALNDATPEAVIARDVPGLLAGNDPRFTNPPLDRMLALDWTALRPAIADSLGQGAIEIGIVGDIDEQAAIDAIARTFGALPPRRPAFDPHAAARQIAFTTDRAVHTLIHQGDADQAVVQTYWPARDDSDLGESVQLQLLSTIIELMLTDELRERLGTTYSPSASADLSSDYPGYGHLVASSNVSFANVAATEAAIDTIAAQLRDQPVSADLLSRARQPLREQLTRARRENGYWLGYVSEATSRPDRIDRSRHAIELLDQVTPADLQAEARRYLLPDRAVRIRAVSNKAPASAP